jgi:hypothetical protein
VPPTTAVGIAGVSKRSAFLLDPLLATPIFVDATRVAGRRSPMKRVTAFVGSARKQPTCKSVCHRPRFFGKTFTSIVVQAIHLHMQAARASDGDWWHGEPLAMRFDGRFLVRNQWLRT